MAKRKPKLERTEGTRRGKGYIAEGTPSPRAPRGTTPTGVYGKGGRRVGTEYSPQGPGGKGTASTNVEVRGHAKKKEGTNEKNQRKAMKGAKFYDRSGKRVSQKDAWNPRTRDWRGGLRIEKAGNEIYTRSSSKEP